MMQQGYFLAVEKNKTVLSCEVFLTIFAFVYFLYLYVSTIRSLR